eukprot:4765356-Pleurochrysis_carterae.AAC.1
MRCCSRADSRGTNCTRTDLGSYSSRSYLSTWWCSQVLEGARIEEDVSAERALCNVVQAGEVVYKVVAGSFAGQSRLGVTRLEIGAWGGE